MTTTTTADVTTARNPRGRPRAFAQEQEAIFQKLFPEIATGRGMQNRMYACRAISILEDSAGDEAFSRFEWLLGASRERPKLKFTLCLCELSTVTYLRSQIFCTPTLDNRSRVLAFTGRHEGSGLVLRSQLRNLAEATLRRNICPGR